MLVNGIIIKQMGKEYFIIQIVMFIKESGLMIKLMEKEHIHILMEQNMLEIGRMINKMVLVCNNGLMANDMKVNIKMERKLVKEF